MCVDTDEGMTSKEDVEQRTRTLPTLKELLEHFERGIASMANSKGGLASAAAADVIGCLVFISNSEI